ncbi:hypothetical protein AUH73_07205 [archaeon 13_1_40CM_4_53_4]|nr:MAG: hypothetical protein AUI07_00980 [archaeon 13_2_20CM_2_53_6]OLC61476.1 MAG: hypothetical protein AUH73_07205 [archaeon 13_1_40CM_4_53_4]OLE59969.1 MAG: hypothetical protein AUG17_00340 [Crenarchaeota archaeon 13_1_20CM_2_53_14]
MLGVEAGSPTPVQLGRIFLGQVPTRQAKVPFLTRLASLYMLSAWDSDASSRLLGSPRTAANC